MRPEVNSSLALFVQSLEEAFTRHRNRVALIDGEESHTFGSLWDRASAMADRINELEPDAARPVALHSGFGASALVAILSILRSGRAYIPLNPHAPQTQAEVNAGTAGARLILNETEIKALNDGGKIQKPGFLPGTFFDDAGIVAIPFTSASTGQAKGVRLPARSVLFHARSYAHHLQINAGDCVSFFPSLHAGVAISNLFGPWLAGAAVCRISITRDGIQGALDKIKRHQLPVLHMIPSIFHTLAAHPDARRAFEAVRMVKLGGEPVYGFDRSLFNQAAPPSAKLFNGLGITEAGGNITFGEVPAEWDPAQPVPIGKTVEGLTVELLHEADPDAGELVVRGRFLSAGYAGQAHHPSFKQHEDGTTSYQTGDWVRRRHDGSLIHEGRTDSMTKILGQFVSPNAIEAALRSLPVVQDCCVFVDETDPLARKMAAAIKTNRMVSRIEIVLALEQRIAREHVPAFLYVVDEVPRLPDGKINRAGLKSKLRAERPLGLSPAPPPANREQAQLLTLWRKALGNYQLGLHDNIIDAGLTSLAAAELIDQTHRSFGIEVNAKTLLEFPTVQTFAEAVLGGTAAKLPSPDLTPVLLRGGGREILVLIPGAGSTVFALIDLAHSISGNFTVYGLQYPGVEAGDGYEATVEGIARTFIDHLEQILPDRPLILCGTSFGGMVAYEMARQLEAKGQPPRFVGMIDTYSPDYLKPKTGWSVAKKLDSLLFMLRPISGKNKKGFANLWQGIFEKINLCRTRLSRRPATSQKEKLTRLLAYCTRASRRYQIKRIETLVHFFFVEERLRPDLLGRDETLGWREASRGGIHTYRIPGRHGLHIRYPHAVTLGQVLGQAAGTICQGP